MTERVYIIMHDFEDEEGIPNSIIDCVVYSLEQAEEYCLRKEKENPNFLFYWVASFLTDEP